MEQAPEDWKRQRTPQIPIDREPEDVAIDSLKLACTDSDNALCALIILERAKGTFSIQSFVVCPFGIKPSGDGSIVGAYVQVFWCGAHLLHMKRLL